MKCPSLAKLNNDITRFPPAWPGSDRRKNRRARSGSLTAPSVVGCGSFGKKACPDSQPIHHDHPFQSRQMTLFDPLWIRFPMDLATRSCQRREKKQSAAEQLRLYLGLEL